MRSDSVDTAHVLVIGSGGAGVRAAIEAAGHGETLIVSKTLAGKGGCTTMAEGGYNAVLREADSCEIHFEDTLKGGSYLNDRNLVQTLVKEAPLRIEDLLKWGAVFDVTDCCEVAQRPFGGQRFPRTCYAGDRTGHEMMSTLIDRLHNTDVRVENEVTIISLLCEGPRVTGAIGLDRRGEIRVMLADSTVLATGGGTRIYDISTNSSSGTGDGYALGYNAGAELIDMEQIQFHPTGAVYPYDARGRLVTEAVRGEGGVLQNVEGERFMKRYDPERMELSTRDVVSRAIATEILEGRGTKNGGVYLDVTHLPRSQIETRLPVMLEQFLKFGVDIRDVPMEVAPTAHHIMGGLRITIHTETTLPGLYACGEVAGGVHGANRLGGNALADTQVFGKRAGEAAARVKERKKTVDRKRIEIEEERLGAFLYGDVTPSTIIRSLQTAMWEGAGIFRTGPELEKTLGIIRHLQTLRPRAASASNLAECCILQNMLVSASLVVRAALLRKESRGAHVRRDITQNWDAEHSPYGHTFLSLSREGIETGAGT
ncbi:MAG: fumarate reductase subunit A [Methanoregulaceae archaeon]|nr:fumarate reductase subunit A [Methanoregulaceae archaeon]